MASSTSTVEWIVKQITDAGEITAKKMFGEWGIYCDDKMVALVCNDQFFVKRTEEGYAFWGEHEEAPPYPHAKSLMVLSEEEMRQKVKLVKLIQTTFKYLPNPKKPKKSKQE